MEELLSIIVPCYNEEEMIPKFFEKIEEIILPLNREYIFINDGSKDKTLKELKKLNSAHPHTVKYLSFTRNFGKEAAIFAGLRKAKGDYVVLMDVDLQDPPELLSEMYSILNEEQYDCVGTRRVNRLGEPPVRSFFAKLFYRVINQISDTEIVDGARDYRMMNRKMVDSVLEVTEYNRFSKGIFSWVGYETKYLEYKNQERAAGQTTWSFFSLLRYSIDGIVSFSDAPLSIASFIGLFSFVMSILLAIFFTIRTLVFDNPTQGWTSLMVVVLAIGGIQLLSIGIVGKYIGKMFLETKDRPHYFIKETEEDNL